MRQNAEKLVQEQKYQKVRKHYEETTNDQTENDRKKRIRENLLISMA
jgi:hypothetical protein